MALEHHDELGLPWDRWADGHVHRLVKGRDFVQSAEVLEEAAANAGRRLGKVARTVTEVRFRNVFFWVQFADCQIILGEPCGRCGSANLRRVSTQYAACENCGASIVVREPRERRRGGPPAGGNGDDALIATLLAGQSQPAKTRAARPRNPRADNTRLGAFTSIVLFTAERDETRELLYGHAVGAGDRTSLLVVDVARRDGRRVEDAAYPAGVVHVARSMPVEPFKKLVHLDRFPNRPPDLAVEDPLAGMTGDPAEEYADEFPWLDAPASRLDVFAGVTLFPRRSGTPTGSAERLFGYARGPDGDTVLLAVRYRLQNGQRVEDPAHPGEEVHNVRWVPLAPFGPVIDADALLSTAAREGWIAPS